MKSCGRNNLPIVGFIF